MKIAIISENDFGFSNGLRKIEHDVRSYKCSSPEDIYCDFSNKYRPDCVFLMDDGRISPSFWDRNNIESRNFIPILIYFTRESLEISENDYKKIESSDLVLTQNNHWITNLAFNRVNIFRFPYWVDTSVFFPDGSLKQYDCVCCSENLDLARDFEAALSSRGLTFMNDPNGGADFLNSGRIFLNIEQSFTVPRIFFEASACKLPILSAELHEYSVIESLFEEEREILYFSSLDECLDRAYLYARFTHERELITQKSFRLIDKYHRIEKRIRTLIKEIKKIKQCLATK